MSSSLNRIKKNIIEAMQSANNQGTSAYDSVAEVRRVEGDTAWVHIAGGVDETPVKLTIAAKTGDIVQVRVGGGRAWITGNASAPPTDDHMANTANTTAKTANVTANQALQGANTAQNTADKAQNSADKAQNTATEAAKTASNYITSSEYGLMVSKNTGEVKETPTTATSRNILITGDNFQIRDGQKVLASYGENTTIGDLNGGNITFSRNGIELSDGVYKAASIKTISEEEENKTSVFTFNGQEAENISLSGRRWYATYYLDGVPSKIQSVIVSGASADIYFPNSQVIWYGYGYMLEGNSITVAVDGSYGETARWNWAAYDTLTVAYTKAARSTGVITGEEVYANNVFVRNPNETYVSLLDFIYPVGSIYMSVNSADPGTLFGGTWQQIQDRFLLSAGDTYAAGNTGGSADSVVVSHSHEQTAHSHGFTNGEKVWTTASGSTEPGNQISGDAKYYAATAKKDYTWRTRTTSETPDIKSTGESGAGKNMPPYLAVYVWKRIS